MKFGTHTHVPLRMNCNNLGDPITFHQALSSSQSFNLSNTLVYDQITFSSASTVLYV